MCVPCRQPRGPSGSKGASVYRGRCRTAATSGVPRVPPQANHVRRKRTVAGAGASQPVLIAWQSCAPDEVLKNVPFFHTALVQVTLLYGHNGEQGYHDSDVLPAVETKRQLQSRQMRYALRISSQPTMMAHCSNDSCFCCGINVNRDFCFGY